MKKSIKRNLKILTGCNHQVMIQIARGVASFFFHIYKIDLSTLIDT